MEPNVNDRGNKKLVGFYLISNMHMFYAFNNHIHAHVNLRMYAIFLPTSIFHFYTSLIRNFYTDTGYFAYLHKG